MTAIDPYNNPVRWRQSIIQFKFLYILILAFRHAAKIKGNKPAVGFSVILFSCKRVFL